MTEERLFSKFGVELEYMLVHKESLDVYPVADQILRHGSDTFRNSVEKGLMGWSNELALHVIEIKNDRPVAELPALVDHFAEQITAVRKIADLFDATLLPTAMHPWMDPHRETRLWPHGNRQIYNTYNRIFDCQGHGWSNLQSAHLNLGFADDAQFGRLHAAIRLLLPVLPALTASSPFAEGRRTGFVDTRLSYYQKNQRRVPAITGEVIPEQVFTEKDYREQIYDRIMRDVAPLDPEGILEAEWLNSRGAIARFDRNAIEIRVLDIQECPRADIALVSLISEVLRAMVAEQWVNFARQKEVGGEGLAELFHATWAQGGDTVIKKPGYLALFGLTDRQASARELWQHLADACSSALDAQTRETVAAVMAQGNLSSRIVRAVGSEVGREGLREVYGELACCLAENRLFLP